jgi:hypothetical protein
MLAASVTACMGLLSLAPAACGQHSTVYINEIYFNQPGARAGRPNPDSTHAYIELRGAPFAPLTNTFLVFLENESAIASPTDAGTIESFFDLGAATLGANGYLALLQKQLPTAQYADYATNPNATVLRNTGSGVGFGSGEGSSIGATSINSEGVATGELEGSGFTALLIRTDGSPGSVPVLNADLDADNAGGFDVPNGNAGWTILDSIALFGEVGEEEAGRTYAPLTFGFEDFTTPENPSGNPPWLQPGQTYVYLEDWPVTEHESEYIGRWGNSTGHAPTDWHVSNLTDRATAGFTNTGDFRQSADPHGSNLPGQLESTQGVPYGTNLTNTIGGPNYPLNLFTPTPGDFDGDGDVDQSDLVDQWTPRFAGGDLNGSDFLDWQRNYGSVPSPPIDTPTGAPVPEPGSMVLVGLSAFSISQLRRRHIPA